MPVRIPPISAEPTPTRSGVTLPADIEEVDTLESDSEGGWGTAALAGGAGLLGAGLIARKPKAVWEGAKTLGRGLSSARQQLMLSGFAPLKSLLGNVGATAVESIERGTMKPLKSLLSMDTARDFKNIYKSGGIATQQQGLSGMGREVGKSALDTGTTLPGPMPGRIMGAMDEAARNALMRSGVGIGPAEAEKIMFQAPLPGAIGEALDSPLMRHLVPFRRTPINQLIEGGRAIGGADTLAKKALLYGSAGTGAVHGAATADDRFPMSVGVAGAAAAKYGLPYALGAIGGRYLAGGQGGGGLASTAVPISEYGIESGVANPFQPFTDPAALRALRRIMGEE